MDWAIFPRKFVLLILIENKYCDTHQTENHKRCASLNIMVAHIMNSENGCFNKFVLREKATGPVTSTSSLEITTKINKSISRFYLEYIQSNLASSEPRLSLDCTLLSQTRAQVISLHAKWICFFKKQSLMQ